MFNNVSAILDSLVSFCCFGQGKKKIKIYEKVKTDIKELTEQHLEHLRAFLLRPIKQRACCF